MRVGRILERTMRPTLLILSRVSLATVSSLLLLPNCNLKALPVSGVLVPELAVFDTAMSDFMVDRRITAGVLGVMRDGCIVYQRGFGWRVPESANLPENTPMRLASVEKPLAAAAIHKAVNAGLISLDQHVFDLGQYPDGILDIEPWEGIGDFRLHDVTVQQLLDHEGGWDPALSPIGDPLGASIHIANEMGVSHPAERLNTTSYMLHQRQGDHRGNPRGDGHPD